MGIFSNKTSKQANQMAKRQQLLGAAEIEGVEAEKARTIAGEQARQRVYGLLGAPGTYETPGTGGATAGVPTGDIFGPGGEKSALAKPLLEGSGLKGEFAKWDSRQGILDPEKYAEDVSKSAAFRIQSRRTAEAEQLLAQEGAEWDKLSNSTYGVIAEGAATQWRDDLRQIRNNAAKGGTARRTALKEAQEMRAQEAANQARVQQTWRANLALHEYVRQNADNVQKMNYEFMDNLPGLRATYQQTMSNLAEMFGKIALPMSATMLQVGFQARASHPKTSTVSRIIGAVAGAAQGFSSGGWLGAAAGGLSGAMGAGPTGSPIEQGMGAGAQASAVTEGLGGIFNAGRQLIGGSGVFGGGVKAPEAEPQSATEVARQFKKTF